MKYHKNRLKYDSARTNHSPFTEKLIALSIFDVSVALRKFIEWKLNWEMVKRFL